MFLSEFDVFRVLKFRYEVAVQDLCYIRFEISTVIIVQVDVLCVVTPCSREVGYRLSIGAYCFCLQS
jgi:hypothetical protein